MTDRLIEQEDDQSQLKVLIAKGKEQGFLTYHEVNDQLPCDKFCVPRGRVTNHENHTDNYDT